MSSADENQNLVDGESRSIGGTTAVAPSKKPGKTKRKPKQLPPYKVILHNDDVNTFEHVIETIVMLTTIGKQEAVLKVLEAHGFGIALLLVTHLERAELYQEQFRSRKLTVTIEPAAS